MALIVTFRGLVIGIQNTPSCMSARLAMILLSVLNVSSTDAIRTMTPMPFKSKDKR
jgi:hypothetical protein